MADGLRTDPLRGLIEGLGVEPGRVSLHGLVALAYGETRPHYIGGVVDAYVPRLRGLVLMVDGHPTAVVESTTPEFAAAEAALRRIGRLPLHETLVEKGGPAPERAQDFTLSHVAFTDLLRAEAMQLDGIVEEDEARSDAILDEVGWLRLIHSEAYARTPCTREEFTHLRRDYVASRHVGLGFVTYYEWWRSSQERVEGDGFEPGTGEKAERMLATWKDPERDRAIYWLSRNLKIHPLHRHVVEATVDAYLAGRAAEADGPGAPSP